MSHTTRNNEHFKAISHQFLNSSVEFELVSTKTFQSKHLVGCDTTGDDGDDDGKCFPLQIIPGKALFFFLLRHCRVNKEHS